MKKFTFLFTMLLLALAGSAATVTDVLTADGLGLKGSYGKIADKSFTSSAVYAGCAMKSSSNGIQINSDTKTIGNENLQIGIATTASGGTVKKVTVAWQSGTKAGRTLNVYGSNSAFNLTTAYGNQGTLIGSIVNGTSTELAITDSYQYIALASNKSAMYIESISIEWETSACSAPQFSLAGGTYYGFAGDKKEIALTCTEGAEIYYAEYDAATTDPSTITNFTKYTTPIEITCGREYSIAAYATCGDEKSSVVSRTWKYEAYATVGSIAEFIAEKPATLTFFDCPLYVTACVGKYLFVRDDAGDAILVFGTIPAEYVNDIQNGTQFEARSIKGKYALYNGMKEVASPEYLKAPLKEPAIEKTQPKEFALEDVTADIQSKYVTIKCAKFNKTAKKLELGSASVAYYEGRFKNTFTVPANVDAYYSVTGVVEMYNNSVQVSPISCAEYKDESPEQVYIVGDVSAEDGTVYDWSYDKGLALTKVYPGVYNGKVVIEHDKYYAVFTALGGNWDETNANKYGLSNQNNVVMNKELPLLKGNQMHQFYSGTFDVTVDLNKMTIKYSIIEIVYPEQLRIIGDLRKPKTYEEVLWNTAVNEPFIANGSSGVYHFDGVVINKGGGFTFTAAVDATEWDGDGNINSWRIGPASAENGANILNQDGTVELLQWQSSNNIFVNPEDFKSTDPAYEDYAFAEYNLTVDLGAGTVTSDPTGFTGTEKIEIKGANVEVSGGTIIVSGAASIYNAAGQAIAINSKAGKFNVPAGLYFVRVDGKVTKVLVR